MRIIVARKVAAVVLLTVLAPVCAGIHLFKQGQVPESEGVEPVFRVIIEYDAGMDEIDAIISKLEAGSGLSSLNGHNWETQRLPPGTFGVDRPPENVLRPTVIYLPPLNFDGEWVRDLPFVHKIEQIVTTRARNEQASALVSGASIQGHAAPWSFGLNGNGIILASADSGIDRGHACFRNLNASSSVGTAVGEPGLLHRKIIHHNTSIDQEDRGGDADFGHGTHTAGSLACWDVEEYEAGARGDWNESSPGEGTAPSYAARLVIQDIVDGDWKPPELDRLLAEGGVNGAIIHSESWGDDVATYTERAGVLDRWSRENPWSVVLFAPGNNGGTVLEPANARNVLSVGAASGDDGVYYQSNKGPSQEGGEGVHLLAPGYSIISAKADGTSQTINGEFMTKTGTSMSTPMAASTLGLIEQMIRDGWLLGDETAVHPISIEGIRPAWWSPDAQSQGAILVGHGFEPSGPLLRSLAGAATTSVAGAAHQSGSVGSPLDGVQGWGRMDLSRLIDWGTIEEINDGEERIPAPGVWVFDSYRAKRDDGPSVAERLNLRLQDGEGDRPIDRLMTSRLTPSGLNGPFLAEGEGIDWRLVTHADTVQRNGGLTVQLAWADRPLEQGHDDLQVCISINDNIHACGNDLVDGISNTYSTLDEARAISSPEFSMEGIRIAPEVVLGADSIALWVFANNVAQGNYPDTLGIDGDRVGFGLTVIGARPNQNGENGTLSGDDIPFTMQTSTPLTPGSDPVMLQISRAMGNVSIIANEGRDGVDMRINDLFDIQHLSQLDIHELTLQASHPWQGLSLPSVGIHACDGDIPPECSEARIRHTEFNSTDLFKFNWDPEFSGMIDVPISVMTTEGGVYTLNLTVFITKIIDGDLIWFNATGAIEAHWLGDLGSSEPIITQSGSSISVRFLDQSKGVIDVVMDHEEDWTWEASFIDLEGGWEKGVLCSDSASQALTSATMTGQGPALTTIVDCEGRFVEISTEWKRLEDIEQELVGPWSRLGEVAQDHPANLVDAVWRIPLELHPWSKQANWTLQSCSILIVSDTVDCEVWMELDTVQSVMLITEWEKDGFLIQDRWVLRGPELIPDDLLGEWVSLIELNGTFNLLRDNETRFNWPIFLEYEPLDLSSGEMSETSLYVPDSWPVKLEDKLCKRLRISIAQRSEVTVLWMVEAEEKQQTKFQIYELDDIETWEGDGRIVNGTSPQGKISIPMTTLGESVKGGCGPSNEGGTDEAKLGAVGGGEIRGWMVIAWGAITAIFVGMILHSKQQRRDMKSGDKVENPFPEEVGVSKEEKPTSD